MKFWQQKWRSMNGFRRMILVVLALMLVGFGHGGGSDPAPVHF